MISRFSVLLLILPFLLLIPNSSNANTLSEKSEFEKFEAIAGDAARIYFRQLRDYPLRGGGTPPDELMAMNGKDVEIVGFMIPYDRIENITTFILLQAPFMGCFHVPPPQANETILVHTDKPIRSYTYDPIMVSGNLTIEEVHMEGYLISVYTIDSAEIRPSTNEDAELDDLPPNFHLYGD